jgi:hypothetical protein
MQPSLNSVTSSPMISKKVIPEYETQWNDTARSEQNEENRMQETAGLFKACSTVAPKYFRLSCDSPSTKMQAGTKASIPVQAPLQKSARFAFPAQSAIFSFSGPDMSRLRLIGSIFPTFGPWGRIQLLVTLYLFNAFC